MSFLKRFTLRKNPYKSSKLRLYYKNNLHRLKAISKKPSLNDMGFYFFSVVLHFNNNPEIVSKSIGTMRTKELFNKYGGDWTLFEIACYTNSLLIDHIVKSTFRYDYDIEYKHFDRKLLTYSANNMTSFIKIYNNVIACKVDLFDLWKSRTKLYSKQIDKKENTLIALLYETKNNSTPSYNTIIKPPLEFDALYLQIMVKIYCEAYLKSYLKVSQYYFERDLLCNR